MRPHVAAIEAFVGVAAGIANRRSMPAADRVARLDVWRRRLHAAVGVERPEAAPHAHEDAIVVALAHSIRSLDLQIAWLDDLVSALAEDIMTTRYGSWSDLLDHCQRAANPLGRLVLRVAGYRDRDVDRSSDAFCTALRLTGWWQNFSHDWLIGRLYVPRDITASCHAREMDLERPFLDEAWTAAIGQCLERTRAQFEAGRGVCDAITGRFGYERRVAWLAGTTLLERIDRAGVALRSQRPTINRLDLPALLYHARRWRLPGNRHGSSG
jgi:phytoene/squalene synthetase